MREDLKRVSHPSGKKKISEEWMEKQNNGKETIFAQSDSESDKEPIKKDITLTKINKK